MISLEKAHRRFLKIEKRREKNQKKQGEKEACLYEEGERGRKFTH